MTQLPQEVPPSATCGTGRRCNPPKAAAPNLFQKMSREEKVAKVAEITAEIEKAQAAIKQWKQRRVKLMRSIRMSDQIAANPELWEAFRCHHPAKSPGTPQNAEYRTKISRSMIALRKLNPILPPMTPEQRKVYEKVRYGGGQSRDAALKEALR